MTAHRHPSGEPCPNCRTDPCPLCDGTGAGEAEPWPGSELAPQLEQAERDLATVLDAEPLELPEVDLDALLDPLAGLPLRERLRARAHALAGDLEHLDGPEADDLAARLAGFLRVLDATTPGSAAAPTTKRRARR